MRTIKLLALCCAASSVLSCTENATPTAPTGVNAKQGGHWLVIPRGSVTVDGTIGPAEWAGALQLPLNISIAGGGSVATDLRLLQDGENLYASVKVPRTDVTVGLGITYDNNRDGVQGSGEDYAWVSTNGALTDGVTIACEGPGGCKPQNDQALGGTLDVTGGWQATTNATEVEFSHPLASADTLDVAVGNNGKLSAQVFVSLIGPGDQFLGVAYYPGPTSFDFGAFRIARHGVSLRSNYWTTVAPLPTPRSALVVGVVNGVLYAVGGDDPNNAIVGTVEAYDPVTNTWTTKAQMPTPRGVMGVGVLNGILYAVGGCCVDNKSTGAVEAYDPVTNSWTAKAPLATPRGMLTVGVVNGLLYAFGGIDQNGTQFSTVEAYDPATNSWTAKAPLPTPGYGMVAGVVNGVVYLVGGAGLNALLGTEAYNPVANSWTAKAPPPTRRQSLAAGVVGRVLYAVGGLDPNSNNLGTMEAYDPVTDTWTTKASLPTPRWALAAGVVNGVLYAVGGIDQSGTRVGTVEAYRP